MQYTDIAGLYAHLAVFHGSNPADIESLLSSARRGADPGAIESTQPTGSSFPCPLPQCKNRRPSPSLETLRVHLRGKIHSDLTEEDVYRLAPGKVSLEAKRSHLPPRVQSSAPAVCPKIGCRRAGAPFSNVNYLRRHLRKEHAFTDAEVEALVPSKEEKRLRRERMAELRKVRRKRLAKEILMSKMQEIRWKWREP
jgi:hypothetical protein